MRDVESTISWYRSHETAAKIGFDPDGMCLKVCRTARNIGPLYPTALAAQNATPEKYRVHRVRDLRRGMVLFFDDPNDSNPYGHIVTMMGRVKGGDHDDLHDIYVRTNGVRANHVVGVRADYFPRHWGDQFRFGATWLNGVEMDMGKKPPLSKPRSLLAAIEDLKVAVAYHQQKGHTGVVRALKRDIEAIRETIENYS